MFFYVVGLVCLFRLWEREERGVFRCCVFGGPFNYIATHHSDLCPAIVSCFSRLGGSGLGPIKQLSQRAAKLLLVASSKIFGRGLARPSCRGRGACRFAILNSLARSQYRRLRGKVLLGKSPILASPTGLGIFHRSVLSGVVSALRPRMRDTIYGGLPARPIACKRVAVDRKHGHRVHHVVGTIRYYIVRLGHVSVRSVVLSRALSPKR